MKVAWEVEYTDEFEAWWHTLAESEQGKVDARVGLLMERGAGDKTGDDRWYETNVPLADRLFERHLKTIEKERTEHG